MKQFSLEEYLKNPSKKVVTRDGRNVKIYCTDYIGFGPIIAKAEGNNFSQMFYSDGRACRSEESTYDLFFAPEKHEGWINIYRMEGDESVYTANVYNSKKEAEDAGRGEEDYLVTIKIEWEE